jgi:hypothetical protein
LTQNRALALLVAQAYNRETDQLAKAIVFRTYTLQTPAGGFNALFSGDGYTYTGDLDLPTADNNCSSNAAHMRIVSDPKEMG